MNIIMSEDGLNAKKISMCFFSSRRRHTRLQGDGSSDVCSSDLDRLGSLEVMTEVEMETATQETIKGLVCGPVRIQIEGFRPIHNDVAFVEMTPDDGEYEPLIGYLVLEQSQVAVDMLGHRLVQVKHMDLK